MTLEVTFADAGVLKHAAETQLARGGLFVAVDASALPPLCELVLRLCGDGTALEVPARLTVATAEAACVEIAAAALPDLLAAIALQTAEATAQAGAITAQVIDPAAVAATEPDAAREPMAPMSLERKLATMSVSEKVQLALHGNRESRQLLLRDRAGVVQSSLVRNPKITLDEILALARAPNLSPDCAETLSQHPTHGMSPQVALALVRNPRTPMPTAIALIARLSPGDLRVVAKGLGLRMQVAAAARKRLVDG